MCGAVRFQVDGPVRDVWNCHCYRCRQFTGHYMVHYDEALGNGELWRGFTITSWNEQ